MSSAAGLDTGALVNHMAVDAFNVMMMFSMGHHIWAVPLKVCLKNLFFFVFIKL